MLRTCYTHVPTTKIVREGNPFKLSYTRLTPAEVSDGKVLAKAASFEEFDFVENSKIFRPQDFALSNIIAVGAYGKLQPFYIGTQSDMTVVDKFANSFASFQTSEIQKMKNNE